ncbi:TPA: hypothetical protein ACXPQL_004123 [Salmonella enterica]
MKTLAGFVRRNRFIINLSAVVIVAIIAASLTGCQSYYALQDECSNGNVEACKTVQSRDRLMGVTQAGLNGYNAQRLTEAQLDAYHNAANWSPIITDRGQPTRCYRYNVTGSIVCEKF